MAALEKTPDRSNFGREYLKTLVRRALADLRAALSSNAIDAPASRSAMLAWIAEAAHAAAALDRPRLRPVINATGVLLHTNLGRAMLAEEAVAALVAAARAPVNLEYDIDSGGRGERDSLVEDALAALTGAEAAAVVNNNAAAVLLALAALAAGREVIVSRGELVEIGGSFRIPDVLAQSGARLREVGTTNRTHPRDYASAIGPETAVLLKVHPSNYRVVGFTREVSLVELVEIGRECGIEVVEDLGSGALVDLAAQGLAYEPIVARSIAAGAGLVTFSGDKLLGGPQAGIIVGKRALIDRLRAHPLRRALRCDKLALAALGATLDIYLRSPDPLRRIPTLRLLGRPIAEIEATAPAARAIVLSALGGEFTVEIVPSQAEVGSGASPTNTLESRALRIDHPRLSPDEIARHFRHAQPPVIGRVNNGTFVLDLRAIENPGDLAVTFPPLSSA
jgi:L-seryl-tRNA(Ser) seleniumtransferase